MMREITMSSKGQMISVLGEKLLLYGFPFDIGDMVQNVSLW
jgi:hypothetical protein